MTQLFYSDELKEIISDLKKQNLFNREAEKLAHKYITIRLIATVAMTSFMLIGALLAPHMVPKIICYVGAIRGIHIDYRDITYLLKTYAVFYSKGQYNAITGEVISLKKTGIPFVGRNSWKLKYQYRVSDELYKKETARIYRYFEIMRYSQGDSITILVNPNMPEQSVIAIPSFRSHFDFREANTKLL